LVVGALVTAQTFPEFVEMQICLPTATKRDPSAEEATALQLGTLLLNQVTPKLVEV